MPDHPLYPPPLPSDAIPPQPAPLRPRWTARELAAWSFIILFLALMLSRQFIRNAEPREQADDSAGQLQLQLMARYAVGLDAITGGASNSRSAQGLEQFAKDARTPADRLRIAILRHKLLGDDKSGPLPSEPSIEADVRILRDIYDKRPPPPEKIAAFRETYGWFADLAIGDADPASPEARYARAAAVRTTSAILIGFLSGALALVAGVVLLVVLLILLGRRRFILPPLALPTHPGAYVEAFAIYLASFLAVSFIAAYLPWESRWLSLSMILPPIAALFWLRRTHTWPEIRATLGLHLGKGLWREIGAGLVGYIAGLPLMLAALLFTAYLTRFTNSPPSHPVVRDLLRGPEAILPVFILASILAPIIEEIMFRGALFAHLRARFSFFTSALLTSLLFAALHPQGWTAIPTLATIALILCFLRQWRTSLLPGITAHALNNTIVLVFITTINS